MAYYFRSVRTKEPDSLIFMTNVYLSASFVLDPLRSPGATALNATEKMAFFWEPDGLKVLDMPAWESCWVDSHAGQLVGGDNDKGVMKEVGTREQLGGRGKKIIGGKPGKWEVKTVDGMSAQTLPSRKMINNSERELMSCRPPCIVWPKNLCRM